MKIAYVNTRYRRDGHDGPHAHTHQFVRNTVALGHEVWMWPGQEHPLAQMLPRSRLARVLALREVDVVYVRLEHLPAVPCRWALPPRRTLLGDPLMVWEFNTVPEFGACLGLTPPGVQRNVERFQHLGRGCDLAVCVSQPLAEYVSGRLGIQRTLVAPNGSDPDLFRPDTPVVRHLRDGDHRAFRVLWLGSAYVLWHDFDLLRSAAEIIWQRGNRQRVVFHLIGRGMKGLAAMPPNVQYHGVEDYAQLPGWMSAMHVGLCLYHPGPADYSSPLKLFDYLSSGLAVVATRQAQTAQILGELGTPELLLAPGDAEGLADRLEALAANRERTAEIGRRARDLLVGKYSWQATIAAALAEIDKIVAARTNHGGRRTAPSVMPAPGGADTRRVAVSVCVATCRRPESLARLLEGLSGLDPLTPDFEVVVVDNDPAGSAAGATAAFSDRLTVRLGVEPRPNLAHARNLSLQMARGDSVAFIDDDEVPDPRWLVELHAAVVASGADGGFGPVEVRFEEDVPAWIRRCSFFQRAPLATGTEVPWWRARTGNALLRRSSIDRHRPFDARFGQTGGEDTDLFYRMIRSGARFIAVESARVSEWRSHRRCSGWWMLTRSFRKGGTIVDVSWQETRGVARLRAWSRAAGQALAEAARVVRHLRARDRAFEHLVNATQNLGIVAVAFGVRYREYRRPG